VGRGLLSISKRNRRIHPQGRYGHGRARTRLSPGWISNARGPRIPNSSSPPPLSRLFPFGTCISRFAAPPAHERSHATTKIGYHQLLFVSRAKVQGAYSLVSDSRAQERGHPGRIRCGLEARSPEPSAGSHPGASAAGPYKLRYGSTMRMIPYCRRVGRVGASAAVPAAVAGASRSRQQEEHGQDARATAGGDARATLLGDHTCDVYLNDVAYWKNIPLRVWEYTRGGKVDQPNLRAPSVGASRQRRMTRPGPTIGFAPPHS
jgi:hypothetical protein